MTDPTAITVTFATSAGATVLSIASTSHTTYTVVSAAPIEETRQRAVITSPDMHGEAEISSVLGAATYGLVIKCRGASWAAVWSARNTLRNAAVANRWRLTVAIGGASETYEACAANVSSPFNAEQIAACVLDVTLSIPVHPVPVT